MEDYHSKLKVKASSEQVFNALTNEVPFWWTSLFEGVANEVDQTFTIRFGSSIFKTMRVVKLLPQQKVIWYVEDSLIGIPELSEQTEWIGTSIIWGIEPSAAGSTISLMHIGLNPKVECYEICSSGWLQFTTSLRAYLETGEGQPFR